MPNKHDFNPSMVRLRVQSQGNHIESTEFQSQYGTIKSGHYAGYSIADFDFNPSMVRLRAL